MDIKIIYEDKDLLVVDKPAGIIVFPEGPEGVRPGSDPGLTPKPTLIDLLVKKHPELADLGDPPRYGIVHRLDKNTSGILLVAKNPEALIFFQKQFSLPAKALQNRATAGAVASSYAEATADKKALADKKNSPTLEKSVEKRYIALVNGNVKEDTGSIHTLIGRSPMDMRKQKAYPLTEVGPGKREAITEYKVLQRYKEFTLLEVGIKTGRRHQIRCHLSYLQHPIAGDKLYSFKNSKAPEGLTRQFLHAKYLKIQLPGGEEKEFKSDLPEELANVLKIL